MSTGVEWEGITRSLMMRASGRCEVQSPWCLTRPVVANGTVVHGSLDSLPSYRVSRHHRRPKGKGGTSREDVDSLANLVLACGTGTVGCHAYVHGQAVWAYERGLLVRNLGVPEFSDPAVVPLVLPSGRVVLLDPDWPWYNDPPNGLVYRDVPLPAGV